MHLVDQARVRIEQRLQAAADRAAAAVGAGLRAAAARACFRASMRLAPAGTAVRGAACRRPSAVGDAGPAPGGSRRCWRLAPSAPAAAGRRTAAPCSRRIGERRGRVALLQGCAQQVLAPRINQAAINLRDPPRHRGRAGQGRAMLRRADPSSRPRRRRAGAGARPTSRLGRGGGPGDGSTPSW